MNHYRETLENQKKVNEAVQAITDYFANEVPYHVHVEQMADAQIEILKLFELADSNMSSDPVNKGYITHKELVLFLMDVNQCLKLLKPFAELANGTKDSAI